MEPRDEALIDVELIDPRTDPRYALERELRYQVLRAPLGLSRAQVGFAGEETALHFVAIDREAADPNQAVLGCVIFDFQSGRLRAMAVDPKLQGRGIGLKLVLALEEEIRSRGIAQVTLHARAQVVGFYQRAGYSLSGEPFEEVGIPHRTMIKKL